MWPADTKLFRIITRKFSYYEGVCPDYTKVHHHATAVLFIDEETNVA